MLKTSKKDTNTLILLKNLLRHLDARRRIQLFGLLFLMLASGSSELISLSSVIPFLAALTEPERLFEIDLIKNIALKNGIDSANQLIIPTIFLFGFAAILSATIRLLNYWYNGKIAAAIGSDLGYKVFRRTLHQPYRIHINRNTSDVLTAIANQIDITTFVITAALQMATSFFVVLGILIVLVLINIKVALITAGLFLFFYLNLGFLSRKRLSRNSSRENLSKRSQIKTLQEGLGAIRDILLDGTQKIYLKNFNKSDRPMRQYRAESEFLALFPRFSLEAFGLLVISFFAFIFTLNGQETIEVISLIGVLALGAQRLLPAMQLFYSSWAQIRGYSAGIKNILEILTQEVEYSYLNQVLKPFIFRENIKISNLSFSYENSEKKIIKNLNLEINKGERIGIIGETGSGKSTLLDILMGLLKPSDGSIIVDKRDIHDKKNPDFLYRWRSSISHVPQDIYLTDNSIAENIAFGIEKEFIDFKKVKLAAKKAQIYHFIETFPSGYDTLVGERGVKLSGGQKQRIGIARALYKNSEVLFLDEASSALDTNTETNLYNAIEKLSRDVTIIMIAHRLTTVSRCDRIILLKDGMIFNQGPPSEILRQFEK